MADETLFIQILLPFIVPAITGLVVFLLRQGKNEGKIDLGELTVTNLKAEITTIKQEDLKELRIEMKEFGKIVQELSNHIGLNSQLISGNKESIVELNKRIHEIDQNIYDVRRRLNGYGENRDNSTNNGPSRSLNNRS